MSEQSRLLITPHGGMGEIGLNSTSFTYGDDLILVDCGLMFPEDHHLGIDVVIPRLDYVVENKDKLKGIVLTHGHEDHIGALPWLIPNLDNPVIYGSPFTLALVEHKLLERNLLDKATLRIVDSKEELKLASFTLKFFPVSHSIVEGHAIGIDTPVGKVLYTGDFKLDDSPLMKSQTDLKEIKKFAAPYGVRLLMSDSTNVENNGFSLNESEVFESLRHHFNKATGRILVTLFASNINRIQEVFDCAQESGRRVVLGGRSLLNNIEYARNLGHIKIPENLILDVAQVSDEIPDSEIVMLLTGSQGEPMSALARVTYGDHRQLRIKKGDTVIMSSRLIPGNTSSVNKMINKLYEQGATVLYQQVEGIHASGHAYRGELTQMLETASPEYFIPLHGEYRHLVKHAELAVAVGVDEDKSIVLTNGHPISFGATDMHLEAPIPAESILVDGKGVGDVGQAILRERHILGDEGVVIVLLIIDKETGLVINLPEVFSRGFVFESCYSHVLEDARCIALEILDEEGKPDHEGYINMKALDLAKVQDRIRSNTRKFFRSVLGRDPVVISIVRAV